MSEWKEYNLGDVVDYKKGFAFKSNWYQRQGRYIVRVSDTTLDSINITSCNCINEELASQYENYSLLKDDVIIATVGSWPNNPSSVVGKVIRVPNEANNALLNQNAVRLRGNEKIDNKFLYYLLKRNKFSKYIVSKAQGSANQASITLKDIFDYSFKAPELEEQSLIANFLSSLDDKIAINRRICENLEAQAQALFKHWFIDFAPFKDGQFVESELGMIPEGWRVGRLTEIAEYLNGLAMQKFPPLSDEDAIPVLKIKELGQSQCDNNSDKCSKQIKPDYIIKNGDVVFSWSGTLMVDIWCGGICGLNQHLFKVTSGNYPKWFYFMWTKHHLAEFIRIAKDKAVTMGHIKRGDLEKALVAIPDSDTLDKISEVMDNIIDKIVNARLESLRLSTLRDTLLPKLMSGEIKV